MEDIILKMAYEEAICDLMLELSIDETDAKKRLNNILINEPNFLEPLYKQFYKIKDHVIKMRTYE